MGNRLVSLAVACALGGSAAAGSAAVNPAEGLVAHYPFDKDAADASGHGHDATAHGAQAVAGGRVGGALAFDGRDDYVALPAAATQGLQRFTIALWVRTTQAKAAPRGTFWQNPTLAGVATNGWGSRDVALMLESGRAAYFHGLRGAEADMAWFSAQALNDDRWHHLALVDDGPRVRLFADGRLVAGKGFAHKGADGMHLGVVTQTASGAVPSAAPLYIGATDDAHGSPKPNCLFEGLIDDVRIWRRALSAGELAALIAQAPRARR